jgi:MOSC domain-containing protein YiiM
MVKRFLLSGRSGFYVAVVREGDVSCGDLVVFTSRATGGTTVEDDFRIRSLEY